MREDICRMNAEALSRALESGELRSEEIVNACLTEIRKKDGEINACAEVFEEEALHAAQESDGRRREGIVLSRFDGIPAGLKDNLCLQGHICGCGSSMLQNFVSPYDATAVRRLKEAGVIPLARLNMDEFGMGGSTETSVYGPCRNPHDPSRVAGGSSGGPAAAVAADMLPWALGSDTGGSIRQPAAFCGIAGIKPRYGAVSRYGLVAFASSLDCVGPIARTVRDAAELLNLIAGKDERDRTGAESAPLKAVPAEKPVIAVPELPAEPDAAVKAVYRAALKALESAGAELRPVRIPSMAYALEAYYIISAAEASSNLARYDGLRYGAREEGEDPETLYRNTRGAHFGTEVKRRILTGTYALSRGYMEEAYLRADRARALLKTETENALAGAHALLMPAAPTAAYPVGSRIASPEEMYAGDLYTVPANLCGMMSVSVPCGRTPEGLPVGLTLTGADPQAVLGASLTLEALMTPNA